MRSRKIAAILAILLLLGVLIGTSQATAGPSPSYPTGDPQTWVIYQIVIDRFYDGNTSNNNPAKSPGLYDPTKTNWRLYWGGDIDGIIAKLPYLYELGVTAIWISPVFDNIDVAINTSSGLQAGYHGYWPKDFKVIEEHFGSWSTFYKLIQEARKYNITVIIDFVVNHSNPSDAGEYGALYDNGTFVTDYPTDAKYATVDPITRSLSNIYNHNGGITNWNDRWEVRYKNLFNLADFNQLNPWVDRYLKESTALYLKAGIGGIRLDAVKHVEPGWLKTYADYVYAIKNVFMFGEWYQSFNDEMYWDMVKFANDSGISVINIPLQQVLVDVFAYDTKTMYDLDNAVKKYTSNFMWQNKLVNFIDSHDVPRFLSLSKSITRFHQVLAFVMTAPGIPVIYYGDEQYLHYDATNEFGQVGGDPYNRPMMTSWDTTTTAFKLIKALAQLRRANTALAYGLVTTRYVSSDVYIFERKFFGNVVLVAINRNLNSPVAVSNVYTSLPDGVYSDYLGGLINGTSIKVVGGKFSVTLPPGSVSVWQYKAVPSGPWVGAIDPTMGRAGNVVVISGEGFGSQPGQVLITNGQSTWSATVTYWSDKSIEFIVPSGVTTPLNDNHVTVIVKRADGATSNGIAFQYLSGRQIPVIFEVQNTKGTTLETVPGEFLWLTGSVPELSNWSPATTRAVGPMLCPAWPNWFVVASVPANTYIEFKFLKAPLGGTGVWEPGSNHAYTTPSDGIGRVSVTANG
ncbi:alpha-amylase family glycosyl hydrolase [Thermofilum pendens]|uniref:Alpha amylase, catalytic region n=1 Tax=Thermofilum pendens (strain DSM 2475 / Hrk 5) TaxID=368408 RepID=A1S071_THEPD|nr:alpha-amylase family glycosyl hydrolase [Thermofilum pendens]ABL78851.1 alpha amylase, catalytic region [Thermofilum pendens Hrk 5]